jgi:hypothetical protein
MTGMLFELLVGGLLLYGLVGLVIAALTASSTGRNVREHDAPIFVTRRNGRATTSTVTTRAGLTRAATRVDVI